MNLEVKKKENIVTAVAVTGAGAITVAAAILFSLPLLFICLPVHLFLVYWNLVDGIGRKTKEVEKAAYYDHLTDQITDQDPSLIILEGKDNEVLISAKPQPKAIEPVEEEKVEGECYGHTYPFVKELSTKLPAPPAGCKWILETMLYTTKETDGRMYSIDGYERDINDCKLTLSFKEKGKKEPVYGINISRFTYRNSAIKQSRYYRGKYMTFADANDKGTKDEKQQAFNASRTMRRSFITAAEERIALWTKINHPPKLESYVIE